MARGVVISAAGKGAAVCCAEVSGFASAVRFFSVAAMLRAV